MYFDFGVFIHTPVLIRKRKYMYAIMIRWKRKKFRGITKYLRLIDKNVLLSHIWLDKNAQVMNNLMFFTPV